MRNQGFSLLELSIVLVIIGLITGGIMAGRSMVRAAELRSIMSDMSKYQAAVNTFKEKYMALPGDMKNATSYWGIAGGTGSDATCQTTASAGTATCNGNGSSYLEEGVNEIFRFWQHLANAGMVEGQYTGATGPGGTTYHAVIGTNVPAAKAANVGYTMYTWNVPAGDAVRWAADYRNIMFIGGQMTTTVTMAGVFTPAEMYSIDQKLDDGLPAYGTVLTYKSMTTCTTTQVEATAQYALTSSGNLCSIIYRTGF